MGNTGCLLVVGFILAVALGPSAITAFGKDKVFSLPRAFHAKTYPAHETHDDEKVSAAADPYDMRDIAVHVFNDEYKKEGVLSMRLILANYNGHAFSLADWGITMHTR